MEKKFLYAVSTLVILALAACGPAPTPTMSAEDIASTAMADAWLSITQTQAAMPTATLIPPTFTPEPTATFLPTIAPLPTLPPATVAIPTTDTCNQVPPIDPQGVLVQVRFVNKSEGVVNLSFGMNSPNDKKECVTYGYILGKDSETVATVLAGCYWGYAWVDGNVPSVAKTGSSILCVTDPSKTPPIWITKENIYFH